jgi:hypothetical protein
VKRWTSTDRLFARGSYRDTPAGRRHTDHAFISSGLGAPRIHFLNKKMGRVLILPLPCTDIAFQVLEPFRLSLSIYALIDQVVTTPATKQIAKAARLSRGLVLPM